MKKIAFVFAVLVAMMFSGHAAAGNDGNGYEMWKHKKFIRLGYAVQDFNTSFGYKLDSKFGIDYTAGRSFFLHKEPVAGIMKFGMDLAFGIDYVMYRQNDYVDNSYNGPSGFFGDSSMVDQYDSDLPDMGCHSIDLGLKVGPSLTINPYDNIRVCTYFHFFPSASFLMRHTNLELGFMPYLNFGVEVSYKWIGLGFETRNGAGRYWDLMGMFMEESDDMAKTVSKYGLNSYNFFIAFRF